jgi:hypothetical protein
MRHFTVTARRRGSAAATRRHERGLRHQAGAEAALLHPVRRAADVEVDLVVAPVRTDGGGLREPGGLAAAQLQRHWVLVRAEPEQAHAIAVQHRLRRHHLGVQQRMVRQQAMEGPAVPVRPIHHRRDAESVR